ncbi:MAG: hypothetical protein ABH821_00945 [archaeon]
MVYKYELPKPIQIDLIGKEGFELREKAIEFVKNIKVKNIEAGTTEEQSYGILAEIVIRNKLGIEEPNPENRQLGWDLKLPSKVKVDVKCRGGTLPFKERYLGTGKIEREAKHNFFARQVWDERLDADIYIMTHLETPKPPRGKKTALPGTLRQRKWKLYLCGWVSKERVKKEGVYLPRGSVTEQGNKWFSYRGNEIEFYNQHLNGFKQIKDIMTIEKKDVLTDGKKAMNLHLTSVDAIRIAIELKGYEILNDKDLSFLKAKLKIDQVPPILHPNQYYHLLKWLKSKSIIKDTEIKEFSKIMQEEAYSE